MLVTFNRECSSPRNSLIQLGYRCILNIVYHYVIYKWPVFKQLKTGIITKLPLVI
jgi:hypothetical protein